MKLRQEIRVIIVAPEHCHSEHVVGNGTAWTNTDGNTDIICP